MKITLITCTYNASQYIERTVNSVLMQTYPDIEHLIIDGKSKDNTVSLAEEYKAKSDKAGNGHLIYIYSEPDKGLYDAMTKGIAKATGDYLCFLNAGDVLPDETTIADIVKAATPNSSLLTHHSSLLTPHSSLLTPNSSLLTHSYSVLYGETDVVDEEGKFLRHRRLQAPEHLTWRSFRKGMLVCHQAFYANTEIAKQTPYNLKYKISGDVDWCIRIMKEGERQGLKTLNVHRVIDNYLAGGMSIKNHRASLMERFHTMREHYGLLDTLWLHFTFCFRAVFKK